jgi:hypothetical protein
MCRVGQNRIYTYIYTLYLVISKPKLPYVHRIYMVLANPMHVFARCGAERFLHCGNCLVAVRVVDVRGFAGKGGGATVPTT